MQCMLPEGRDQLATKGDLRLLKDDLKALEVKLRSEFKEEFANLRAEFAEFKAEIRTELRTELAKLTRHFAFMLVAFMTTIWATMIPIALAI